MAYIQPCFIHKNTKEIREYLRSLGYKNIGASEYDNLGCDGGWINDSPSCDHDGIDCGTNEELFKALASLQDTTDINQWYTDGSVWHLCNFRDISTEFCRGDTPFRNQKFHKATVEELINHFQ